MTGVHQAMNTKKAMDHLLAIPCYTGTRLSAQQLQFIDNWVTTIYGSKALHPDLLLLLTVKLGPFSHVLMGAVAYHVLVVLVRVEHTIAEREHGQLNLETCLPSSRYVEWLAKQIAGKEYNPQLIKDLCEDHYMMQDTDKLFPSDQPAAPRFDPRLQLVPLLTRILETTAAVGPNNATAIVILDPDYRYAGHIYVWTEEEKPNILHAMGIRRSLYHLLTRSHPGVAPKLIAGVLTFARRYRFRQVKVVHPYPVMRSILSKIGFTVAGKDYLCSPPDEGVPLTEYGLPTCLLTQDLLSTKAFEHDLGVIAEELEITVERLRPIMAWDIVHAPQGWLHLHGRL